MQPSILTPEFVDSLEHPLLSEVFAVVVTGRRVRQACERLRVTCPFTFHDYYCEVGDLVYQDLRKHKFWAVPDFTKPTIGNTRPIRFNAIRKLMDNLGLRASSTYSIRGRACISYFYFFPKSHVASASASTHEVAKCRAAIKAKLAVEAMAREWAPDIWYDKSAVNLAKAASLSQQDKPSSLPTSMAQSMPQTPQTQATDQRHPASQ